MTSWEEIQNELDAQNRRRENEQNRLDQQIADVFPFVHSQLSTLASQIKQFAQLVYANNAWPTHRAQRWNGRSGRRSRHEPFTEYESLRLDIDRFKSFKDYKGSISLDSQRYLLKVDLDQETFFSWSIGYMSSVTDWNQDYNVLITDSGLSMEALKKVFLWEDAHAECERLTANAMRAMGAFLYERNIQLPRN